MKQAGYVYARRLKQNYFFVRNSMDRDVLRSCCGEIQVEDVLHPLGERATHPQHRGRVLRILCKTPPTMAVCHPSDSHRIVPA
jgi:hypothetical protein